MDNNNGSISVSNNTNSNKFLLSNGNNFIDNNKHEQIMNYLNNSSKYYNSNQNVNSTTQSTILDTTSYQDNNNVNNNSNNNNNNSLYLTSNNIEDHELDLWLREFTMDNFPLNTNNIPNINHNNNNNSQINSNSNDNNNIIDNQYNSTSNSLINQNGNFVETAAQDKYLKIRKLKNIAIEDRAKKNEEMNNYTPNLSLLNHSFNIMNDNNNNTSNTYNNKSFLNEASSSSSKFSVTDTMDIYKSNSAYPYSDGYKQVSNLHQFLMNERINENQQQNQYSNNNYTASEFIINKKDNIFDSFNMVNSSGDKDLPFITESNSSISKSSEFDNAKGSGSKGKELSVEEKLNDKRKRNNAASARFRAKKKLKEQMTDLTAKEMTQKAQTLEIKVKEMELEIKWLRSLVTKNMESKTLKDVYEENGYLFINENDSSQNSQPDVNGIKLVSISDSVKSYTKCCCNIDKSKGGTCGKNGTIGHCKCGGIGYCLMNVNMNKNKKIIKPKITSNQYSLLSKTTV